MIRNWIIHKNLVNNTVELSVKFSTTWDAIAFAADIDFALQEQFDAQEAGEETDDRLSASPRIARQSDEPA